MARRKNFCCVGSGVSEETIQPCASGKHFHLSWREVNAMFDEGEIEPLTMDEAKKPEAEPDYVFRWLVPGRVLQSKRHIAARGISAKYGDLIAAALERREQWARVWVSTVRGQIETGA
jgi:hypothetical protein